MTHDAVIVGAGPSGAAVAAGLARHGHDVLLIDRKNFPRDKACGDGIPPGTIEILNGLGMTDEVRAAGFYPIRGIRVGSPWGRTWDTRFRPRRPGGEFVIAPRMQFDAMIQAHALECGAAFRVGKVHGPLMDGDRVVGVTATIGGTRQDIAARLVIGADGATSAIARALQGERPPREHRGVALRAYVDGVETMPNTVEFYFHRRFLPGYAWVFPMGNRSANVGVIMRSDRYRKKGHSLESLLDEFFTQPAIRDRLSGNHTVRDAASWQLPYGVPPHRRRAFDGALLVGDAGWFVDSLTGEGIHNALVSSTIAAGVAHQALERGDCSRAVLERYDAECQRELGPLLERAHKVQRFVAAAPPALEALFMAANVGPRLLRKWLNRKSTDFFIE